MLSAIRIACAHAVRKASGLDRTTDVTVSPAQIDITYVSFMSVNETRPSMVQFAYIVGPIGNDVARCLINFSTVEM